MPKYCKCTFEYDACDDDELTLKEDDIIEITDDTGEGWWVGKLRGSIGTFPSNFVEPISAEEAGFAAPPPVKPTPVPIPTPALAPAAGGGKHQKARADFEYEATDEDELSFQEGDIIDILDKDPGTSGWWKASMNGRVGLVPDNFFTVIDSKQRSSSCMVLGSSAAPPLITAAALAAPLKKVGAPTPAKQAPAAPATTDWRAQLKNRNQNRGPKPKPAGAPAPDTPPEVPEWMKKRKAACGEGDPPAADPPPSKPAPSVPVSVPKSQPPTKASPSVGSKPAEPPMPKLPSKPAGAPAERLPAEPPMSKFPPKPAGAPPPSMSSTATPTKPVTGGSFRRPPSMSSAGRTSSTSSVGSNPSSRRSSDVGNNPPVPGNGDRDRAAALPDVNRNPGGAAAKVRNAAEPSWFAAAKSSFRTRRSLTSVSDGAPEPASPPSGAPVFEPAAVTAAATAAAGNSAQIANVMELVSALTGKVSCLESSLKTMQGTIHHLESEVDSEKKLRASCEVELQRIRLKLNEKELSSF